MSIRARYIAFASLLFAVVLSTPVTRADDWPQWMGPDRDGVYGETGLATEIPAGGLPVLWRTKISGGYSGPAVVAGRVFVTDYVKKTGESTNNPGGRDELTGTERVLCLDATSGDELWKYEYDRPYKLSFAAGPRATPTVDGDRVYVLGAQGDLLCLTAASGDLVWKKQLAEEYSAEPPTWGHAAHPLVHGDLLYCLAGGKGSVVVALNKMTGTEVWKGLSASEMGYCPPSIRELGGKEQLIIWHADSLNALDPLSGELSWTYPLKPAYGMSIAIPQWNDNKLFATGIGQTAAMIEIGSDGKPGETLWKGGDPKDAVYSGNATALFEDDVILGSDCGTGAFIAVNPKDGTRYWETFQLTTGGKRRASHGTAFIVKNGDRYILFTETGDLVFADLSKEGFEELGRMHVLSPSNQWQNRPVVWCHPAYANKCMFVRNDQEIVCVSLAAQ